MDRLDTVSPSEAVAAIHSYADGNGFRQGGWVKTKEDPLNPHEETTTRTRAQGIRHVPLDEGGYSSRAHLDDASAATLLTTEQLTIVRGEPAATMMTEGRGLSNAQRQLRHPSWRQGFQEDLA
ncbi:hypothetical protein ACQEVF_44405 [Nonomuraea polychroma]|uniref:hypothetical protein n=1 Tax=Nonomuraea polychroma TaxID=46176 RepID=UPI003D9296A9